MILSRFPFGFGNWNLEFGVWNFLDARFYTILSITSNHTGKIPEAAI